MYRRYGGARGVVCEERAWGGGGRAYGRELAC